MGLNDGKVYTDIYNKPESELLEIAKEFSEGCVELEACLLTMWKNKLYTKACCKGTHDPCDGNENMKWYVYSCAYILAMKDIDFFSYLSEELIKNDNIELFKDDGCESINIYGENKEELIEKLTMDISTGIKENQSLLKEKISKKVSVEVLIKTFIYEMRTNHYQEEDIQRMLPIAEEVFAMEYNWDPKKVTEEQIKLHMELQHRLAHMIEEAYKKKNKQR